MASQYSKIVNENFNKIFSFIGRKSAEHPYTIISTVLLFTLITSLKVPLTEIQDDVQRGYSLPNARSFDELDKFRAFNGGLDPVTLYVLIMAKDKGSMSRLQHLNETVEIIDYIGMNFGVKNITYYDMCNNFCMVNEVVRQFRNGLIARGRSNASISNGNEIFNVSYPIMRLLGMEIDLTPSIFGVDLYSAAQMNDTTITNIKDVKLIVLQFRGQKPTEWTLDDQAEWERSVGDFYRKEYNSSRLRVMTLTMALTQDEVVRTGMTLVPYISLGFIVMLMFSISTVYINTKCMDQWSIYKVIYPIFGCICPLLATSSALGLLFYLGLRFGSIILVTPFLVLAIGVDDAFLMINSLNRIVSVQMHKGSRESTVSLIVEMLVDVGPSITITSLTNMLAFGIGAYMSIPEIRILCVAIATAIFMDYLYTLTIYTSIMSIGAKYELLWLSKEIPIKNKSPVNEASLFVDKYSEWLTNGFTSVLLLFITCIYWIVCIRAALSANAGLTPDKLFLSDSPLIEMNAIRDKYVLPVYTVVTVFVNNPGDLQDTSRISTIKNMIEEFEALPECNGKRFTHFWIRDYESYLNNDVVIQDDSSYSAYSGESLNEFFDWPEYSYWKQFVSFRAEAKRISSFYVTISFHGENQADWIQKLQLLNRWRAIVDKYENINASVYNDEAFFTEQFETLIPMMMQTALVVLLSMTIICFLFMANLFNVIIAVAAILSICIGVFGLLSLWHVDVDPISIATMIMCIGLAVDFPAHITFHYNRNTLDRSCASPKKRISLSLISIGFPLLQCCGSTVLLAACLLMVPTYMSEVFVKAIALVISLGAIHALILVPALLCAFSSSTQKSDSASSSPPESMRK